MDAVEFLLGVDTDNRQTYIITDPPYGNVDSPNWEGPVKDPVLSPEYMQSFSDACFQKARGTFLFCGLYQSQVWAKVLSKSGYEYVRTGVWIKPNAFWTPTPYTGGALEGFVYASKTRSDGTHSRIPAYVCSYAGHHKPGEEKHPFRKPVPLVRQIIRDLSIHDKIIIDPFAGGGSIGVSALLENNINFSNDLDGHVINNLEWRLSNYEMWASSQPKRGIVVAGPRKPRKTHKPRAAEPVADVEKHLDDQLAENAEASGDDDKKPPKPRKTRPLNKEQKKQLLSALLIHTAKKKSGKGMTEREFLTILLGPDYNKKVLKGQKRQLGTLGRMYPLKKLWAECNFIQETLKIRGQPIHIPKANAKEKKQTEYLDILDQLD
jgi:hypothetical protein